MSDSEVDALLAVYAGGIFFWWILWNVFFVGLHVVIANRFKRSNWKWAILGFFFGVFSLAWLIALGKKHD